MSTSTSCGRPTADDRAGAGHLHGGVVRQGGTTHSSTASKHLGHFSTLATAVAAFLNQWRRTCLRAIRRSAWRLMEMMRRLPSTGGKYRAQADRTIAEHDRGVARLDFGRGRHFEPVVSITSDRVSNDASISSEGPRHLPARPRECRRLPGTRR